MALATRAASRAPGVAAPTEAAEVEVLEAGAVAALLQTSLVPRSTGLCHSSATSFAIDGAISRDGTVQVQVQVLMLTVLD